MTVREAAAKLGLNPYKDNCEGLNAEIGGCYIGDVLSLAMLRIKRGDIWITVQKDINVSAVAYMTGAAMVITADGASLDKDAAVSAAERGVPVFGSEKSAYELATVLSDIL